MNPLPYPKSVPAHPLRHDPQPTFSEILAEQSVHAPWLGVSLLAHAGMFAILLMLPAAPPAPANRVMQMTPAPQDVALDPEQAREVREPQAPPDPQTPPDPTSSEPVLSDASMEPLVDPSHSGDSPVENATMTSLVSAGGGPFDGAQWVTTPGLGGGAGSRIACGRRGGKGSAPGGRPTIDAIDAALSWLARHQDEDGKWDADEFMKHDRVGTPCSGPGNGVHDVGVTGLALLAFLGDGSTLRSGPYRSTLKRGVAWLVAQQQENGLLGTNTSHDFVYDHAIACYALCEAYGLSEYRTLRPYAQKAIGYLEAHRNPYAVWRYQPSDGDNDLSVTGWCIMALKSASDFGLAVDKRTFAICSTWLDQVTDPKTGRAGYTRRGEPSSRHPGDHGTRFPPDRNEAMTGVALVCRYFLGQSPKDVPAMNLAVRLLLSKPPRWDKTIGSIDLYAWYYSSYALYQHGGPAWTEWSKALTQALIEPQRKDGNSKGSWDPEPDVWGEDGGRVVTTALGALTLQSYYRYSRVLR